MPNWFKQNYFTIWLSLVMVSGTDLMATCGLFGLVPWVDWALHSHAWYQRAVHVTFEKKREKRKKEKGVEVGGFALHWNCVKCKENAMHQTLKLYNVTKRPLRYKQESAVRNALHPSFSDFCSFVWIYNHCLQTHTHTHTHTRAEASQIVVHLFG